MFTKPSTGRFYEETPQVEEAGLKRWVIRAKNFAVIYTQGDAGAVLNDSFEDEHFAYSLEGGIAIQAGDESGVLVEEGLAIIPPEQVEFRFTKKATLAQVITAQEQLASLAPNQNAYGDGADMVAPITPWPEPIGGYKLRIYDTLAGYAKGGLIHAYRTRKLMIVPYARFLEQRDETQLSPHSHEDFEQASLALEGEWQHHLRVPWTINKNDWRADEHLEMGSPSVAIIPAQVIHTSQGVGGEGMRLLDIFAPPREDFSMRGVVDNADEYPMPKALTDA